MTPNMRRQVEAATARAMEGMWAEFVGGPPGPAQVSRGEVRPTDPHHQAPRTGPLLSRVEQ
jgi:hypothetical protein